MTAATLAATSGDPAQLGGLVGLAAQVLTALGEVGVGLLTLVETVFPPIPSEVVLSLAGFLAAQGTLNFALVLLTATLGGYLGALILYVLGRTVGEERTVRVLAKLPLVDRDDFEKAAHWFSRHGRSAVFFGRLIPGVRSLISLPAGAAKMSVLSFTLFTVAGTLLWNTVLVTAGVLLGSQYELVAKYSDLLNYAVYAAIGAVVLGLVVRRIRRARAARSEA